MAWNDTGILNISDLEPISCKDTGAEIYCHFGKDGDPLLMLEIMNSGISIYERKFNIYFSFDSDLRIQDQQIGAFKWCTRVQNLQLELTRREAAKMLSSDNKLDACRFILHRVIREMSGSPLSLERGSQDELTGVGNAISQIIGGQFCLYGLRSRSDEAIRDSLILHDTFQVKPKKPFTKICEDLYRYFMPVYTEAVVQYEQISVLPRQIRFIDASDPGSSHDVVAAVNTLSVFYDSRILEGFFTEEDKMSVFAELGI